MLSNVFALSQIPSSAVEMPDDLNTSIGYLDVQFGAMDFMDSAGYDDSKYVGGATATAAETTTASRTTASPNHQDDYKSQGTIGSALQQAVSIISLTIVE